MRFNMSKKILLLIFSYGIYGNLVVAQNCGRLSTWSCAATPPSGGNTTYTIDFSALSVSGGSKSVTNLTIICNGATLNTNSTCFATNPASGAPIQ